MTTVVLKSENVLLADMRQRFARCLEIARAKNADYAGGDDPFANFRMASMVGVDPARAILVRVTDKLARMSRLLDRQPAVAAESVEDSIDDAINYLAILGALFQERGESARRGRHVPDLASDEER